MVVSIQLFVIVQNAEGVIPLQLISAIYNVRRLSLPIPDMIRIPSAK